MSKKVIFLILVVSMRTLLDQIKACRVCDHHLPFGENHPSGRNSIWQAKNPWFKQNVLPHLKSIVADII